MVPALDNGKMQKEMGYGLGVEMKTEDFKRWMLDRISMIGSVFVRRSEKTAAVQRMIDRALTNGEIKMIRQEEEGTWYVSDKS